MEQEISLQVAIQNRSLMLQEKQSKSIIKWAQTPQELEISKAIDGGIEISKFNKRDDEDLINYLGQWRIMIGDPRKQSKESIAVEQLLITNKLKELYPFITLPEIKLAADMSITGKLSVAPHLYQNQTFSVLYVTAIINAYLEYKREQLLPVFERFHTSKPEKRFITVQQERQLTIDLFKDEYDYLLKNGVIDDPMNLCYRFLRESNRLPVYPKDLEDAKSYGREMAKLFFQKEDGSVKEALAKSQDKTQKGESLSVKKIEDRYSRNFLVQLQFNKLTNIEQLTDTFNLQEFIKVFHYNKANNIIIPNIPEYSKAAIATKKGENALVLKLADGQGDKFLLNLHVSKRKVQILGILDDLPGQLLKECLPAAIKGDKENAIAYFEQLLKMDINPKSALILKIVNE